MLLFRFLSSLEEIHNRIMNFGSEFCAMFIFFFSVLKDTFLGFEFNKACLLVVVVLKSLYPSLHFQVYARYEPVIQPQHPKNTKKTQFWLGLLRKGSGPGWSIQRSF